VWAFYGDLMRLVAWWALLSSGLAPVVLISGWTAAELLEGPGYDPVTQTISVLAAGGACGYWVLTVTLITVGACYLVTALGLHAATLAGRLSLGGGGVSAMLLAMFPAPRTGGSLPHGSVVAVGFTLLALWPVLTADRSGVAPWGLRFGPSIAVTALMWAGALWFVVELQVHGSAGVAERVVTSAQSLWPVVVVTSCLLHSRPARNPT
jgi:hypothetical membrane protein